MTVVSSDHVLRTNLAFSCQAIFSKGPRGDGAACCASLGSPSHVQNVL